MQLKTLNKKGQLSNISGNVISLGVAAIILILMLVILSNLREVDTLRLANSDLRSNESVGPVTVNVKNLIGFGAPRAVCSISEVYNATGSVPNHKGGLILAGNYTITNDGCSIAVNPAGTYWPYNNSNWNITYSYTYAGEGYASTNKTLIGIGTFGDFWTIIVLAIVAAVVIGVVFSMFGRPRQR
jgi:hypothetical protein